MMKTSAPLAQAQMTSPHSLTQAPSNEETTHQGVVLEDLFRFLFEDPSPEDTSIPPIFEESEDGSPSTSGTKKMAKSKPSSPYNIPQPPPHSPPRIPTPSSSPPPKTPTPPSSPPSKTPTPHSTPVVSSKKTSPSPSPRHSYSRSPTSSSSSSSPSPRRCRHHHRSPSPSTSSVPCSYR